APGEINHKGHIVVDTLAILKRGPVMPVMVIQSVDEALQVTRALQDGGINTFEITLRTSAALDGVRELVNAFPQALIGVGTVRDASQLDAALQAGARFAVSPGLLEALLPALTANRVPFLPGVATPTEAMNAFDAGFHALKLFPAEAVGGIPLLKSLQSPLPDIVFCPTGGIHAANAAAYLALPNVACVGGSWLAPADLVKAQDWRAITALAAAAGVPSGQAQSS